MCPDFKIEFNFSVLVSVGPLYIKFCNNFEVFSEGTYLGVNTRGKTN